MAMTFRGKLPESGDDAGESITNLYLSLMVHCLQFTRMIYQHFSSLWADKHCCRCAFYKVLGSMHQWLYRNYLGNVVINSEFNNIPKIKSVVGPYFRIHYNINIEGGSDQHDLFSIPLSRLN